MATITAPIIRDLTPAPAGTAGLDDYDPDRDATYDQARWERVDRWYTAKARWHNRQPPAV